MFRVDAVGAHCAAVVVVRARCSELRSSRAM